MGSPVLVAEDDAMVAMTLRHFFESRGVAIALMTTLAAAMGHLEGEVAWLGAVIDVGLPDGNGMDLLEAFRERFWTAPVLVLTGRLEPGLINAAQRFGAEYVVKPMSVANLVAFAERLPLPGVDDGIRNACAALAQRYRLTPTEARIVELSAAGVSRDEIPMKLGTSENTVKTQVRAILKKTERADLGDVVRSVWRQVAAR